METPFLPHPPQDAYLQIPVPIRQRRSSNPPSARPSKGNGSSNSLSIEAYLANPNSSVRFLAGGRPSRVDNNAAHELHRDPSSSSSSPTPSRPPVAANNITSFNELQPQSTASNSGLRAPTPSAAQESLTYKTVKTFKVGSWTPQKGTLTTAENPLPENHGGNSEELTLQEICQLQQDGLLSPEASYLTNRHAASEQGAFLQVPSDLGHSTTWPSSFCDDNSSVTGPTQTVCSVPTAGSSKTGKKRKLSAGDSDRPDNCFPCPYHHAFPEVVARCHAFNSCRRRRSRNDLKQHLFRSQSPEARQTAQAKPRTELTHGETDEGTAGIITQCYMTGEQWKRVQEVIKEASATRKAIGSKAWSDHAEAWFLKMWQVIFPDNVRRFSTLPKPTWPFETNSQTMDVLLIDVGLAFMTSYARANGLVGPHEDYQPCASHIRACKQAIADIPPSVLECIFKTPSDEPMQGTTSEVLPGLDPAAPVLDVLDVVMVEALVHCLPAPASNDDQQYPKALRSAVSIHFDPNPFDPPQAADQPSIDCQPPPGDLDEWFDWHQYQVATFDD